MKARSVCLGCYSSIPSELKGKAEFCSQACEQRHLSFRKPKKAKKKEEAFPLESTAHLPSTEARAHKKKRSVGRRRTRILALEKEVKALKAKLRECACSNSSQVPKPKPSSPSPDPFFSSREWQELRYRVIKVYGRKCMACGETSGIIQVDHIKPRVKHPELALDFNNLQVLCKPCNLGKSYKDDTDFRPHMIGAKYESN